MRDGDEKVQTAIGVCFHHMRPEQLDEMREFIEEFLASPALLSGALYLVEYVTPLATDEHDLALVVASRILDSAGTSLTSVQGRAFTVERSVVRLPLNVYNHSTDPAVRSRAMDIFERFLEVGSRTADEALRDWDRR